MGKNYVIGVDFGSDSVRAVILDTASGKKAAQGVSAYSRWQQGLYQHPEQNIFRQHPLDYLESIEACVAEALSQISTEEKKQIKGIGVDTTGSTPAPVDRNGVPLALLPEFAECEDAMFHLWKDHSAAQEAEEIQELFSHADPDYTQYQGKYSSEWYWAKILHTTRKNPRIRAAAYTWEEHSDWIIGELCANTAPESCYHSACAAGHKALWHSRWNGLPAEECLEKLDPYLVLVAQRYGNAPQPATVKAGTLSPKWARKWGLSEEVVISGSSFDAHAGAVGAGIYHKTLVCTLGTSAVDMLVAKPENLEGKDVRRYCGQAENSIVPGCIGIETGQASFGDDFAWFKRLLCWPLKQMAESGLDGAQELYRTADDKLLVWLEESARELPPEPFPIALDWFNGRRYPDTDDFQTAAITGLTLGVTAPMVYRALVFGVVCGLKRLVEGFEQEGVEIDQITAVGGVAGKSAYLMQMMSDALGKKVCILDSEQTCARGAAIYAAVAAGIFRDMPDAFTVMAAPKIREYVPDPERNAFYQKQYARYLELARKQDQ